MWIFLGILAFLIVLIAVILMLPVDVILKTDPSGELIFRYKFLNKMYGENPDPSNPVVKILKDASGLSRVEKEKLADSIESGGLSSTISESLALIISLLKRLLQLLAHCKVKVLKLNIVCAEGDAAKTAIGYGTCHAIVWPIIGLVHSNMKVREKGEAISISCDYSKEKGTLEFETVICVRVFRALVALILAAMDEAKRIAEKEGKHN